MVTMQNQNMPAFPQQDQSYDEYGGRWSSGPSHSGFTKREWITLQIFRALIQAQPPITMTQLGGAAKLLVPSPETTAHLADQLAQVLLRVFDQHAAGQAADHPLNRRPAPADSAEVDIEIADD